MFDAILRKKLLFKLIIFLLIVSMSVSACLFCCLAYAESQNLPSYVRVVKEDVYLYAKSDKIKIVCELEKSYYLQVLDKSDGCFLVTVMGNSLAFPKITGYVDTKSVDECLSQPAAPFYPSVKLTVNSDSANIYLSPLLNSSFELTAINTQDMSYYGSIVSDGLSWYYVCFKGSFGYVLSSKVTAPAISLHPTPLPGDIEKPVVTPPSGDGEKPKTSAAEILLIAFVAVLSIGLVLALFLPGNGKHKNEESCFDKNI